MIDELDLVVLKRDLPKERLGAGGRRDLADGQVELRCGIHAFTGGRRRRWDARRGMRYGAQNA